MSGCLEMRLVKASCTEAPQVPKCRAKAQCVFEFCLSESVNQPDSSKQDAQSAALNACPQRWTRESGETPERHPPL